MIHTGDCIEVMRGMEADSVDAVVTDPPYGLEFMGREWDRFDGGQQGRWKGRKQDAGRFDQDGLGAADLGKRLSARPNFGTDSRGQKCRKCGHYKFSGTPCKCPEPEWEIRTGTPPNMAAFQAWCTEWATEALRVTKPGGYLLAFGGTRTHHRLVCGLEDAGWIIRDELDWIYASGFPKGKANLKPAHEPIVLARKPGPLRPLNIEETRIPGPVPSVPQPAFDSPTGHIYGMKAGEGRNGQMSRTEGRWPSNLLLSDPELFDEPNPYVVGSGAIASSGALDESRITAPNHIYGARPQDDDVYAANSGGYSRFFIIPKADRADREPVLRGQTVDYEHSGPRGHTLNGDGTPRRPSLPRENAHPTVKPVDLMRHLIRLVTPPGGTILDPFLGSGSTAIAAELEGFPWIGIEKEPEYVAIAEARLNGTQRGLGLDVGAPTSTQKGRARPDSQMPEWPVNWRTQQVKFGFYGGGESRPDAFPDEEPAA